MLPPDAVNATRRLAAAALVLCLALGACGGGGADGEGAGPASPTPGTGASPSPETIEIGGGEPGATPPGAMDGAAGTTPAPLPTQAQDPAGSVTALFEAIRAGDAATQLTLTTGPMRTLMRIRDVIRQENERRGATTSERVEVARAPRTAATEDGTATVDVQAKIVSEVSGERGTVPSEATIAGPVELRRSGDGWVVADLVYAGSRLGPAYHPVAASQTKDELRLEVPAVLSYKSTTAVLLRFVNTDEGGVPVNLRRVVLVGPAGEELDEVTLLAIESGPTPVIVVGYRRIDGSPRGVRVELVREDTDETVTFDITF